ncbi:hypothetical protein [Bacillus sp. FSL R12-0069]|uniref:hypothetical protein n=1 Tax=Bacillus sp. FSL R12-0069 TaxID=2975342 RepID=UPI0030F5A858
MSKRKWDEEKGKFHTVFREDFITYCDKILSSFLKFLAKEGLHLIQIKSSLLKRDVQ